MFSDNTIQSIQSSSHVEQSVSVDPNVSHQGQKNFGNKKKKRRRQSKESLEQQAMANANNENDGHIDYRA